MKPSDIEKQWNKDLVRRGVITPQDKFSDIDEIIKSKQSWELALEKLIIKECNCIGHDNVECYFNEIIDFVQSLIDKAKKERIMMFDKKMTDEMTHSKEWAKMEAKVIEEAVQQEREQILTKVLAEFESAKTAKECRHIIKEKILKP